MKSSKQMRTEVTHILLKIPTTVTKRCNREYISHCNRLNLYKTAKAIKIDGTRYTISHSNVAKNVATITVAHNNSDGGLPTHRVYYIHSRHQTDTHNPVVKEYDKEIEVLDIDYSLEDVAEYIFNDLGFRKPLYDNNGKLVKINSENFFFERYETSKLFRYSNPQNLLESLDQFKYIDSKRVVCLENSIGLLTGETSVLDKSGPYVITEGSEKPRKLHPLSEELVNARKQLAAAQQNMKNVLAKLETYENSNTSK